jgi:hypothetical protein
MRCLAVCQNEIVIRMLNEALSGSYDLEFLVQSKTLGRKLRSAGFPISVGDPERTAFFLRADLTPGTAVIIEDNGQQRLIPIIDAAHDAGGTLIYVLGASGGPAAHKREQQIKKRFPDISYLTPGELFGSALAIEFSRSLTRLRVQQYRHYLADARRVLILLHNDPDPDAMASGLALRSARECADAADARYRCGTDHLRVALQLRSRGHGGRAASLFWWPGRPR